MRIKELLLAIAVIAVIASCGLLPCTQQIRNGEPYVYSAVSLKQIGFALHDYRGTYDKWPPAVVTDKAGKPLYSWRVSLLPFLEQQELHKQFKLDEPWDSPANQKLLEKTPPCFVPVFPIPEDPPGTTRYQAIVGPGTAWERFNLRLDKDFPDGPEQTIMVVESAKPVLWSQPVDLEFDPKGDLPALSQEYSKAMGHFFCYVTSRARGSNVLFADATVKFLRADIDVNLLRALVTRSGGENIQVP